MTRYGWVTHTLPGGGLVRLAKLPVVSIAKLHRPPQLTAADLVELERLRKEHHVAVVKASPAAEQDLAVFAQFGYSQRGSIDLPPRTVVINLQQDEATLWQGLTKDCRYSITRSRTAADHIELTQAPSPEVVAQYYQVVNARSKRVGFYTPPLADHMEKIRQFGKEAYIGTVYSQAGVVLGSKLFLGYAGCVWYMYSGLTGPGAQSLGNYQLMWECIRRFKQLGYSTLDMEGLADDRLRRQTKNWRNYTDYKLQFGGTVVTFPLPYTKYATIFELLNLRN